MLERWKFKLLTTKTKWKYMSVFFVCRYVWYNSIYQSGKSDYDVKPLKQLKCLGGGQNAYSAPQSLFGGAAAPAASHFSRPWVGLREGLYP